MYRYFWSYFCKYNFVLKIYTNINIVLKIGTCYFNLKELTMAIIITDECINCGACEPECPNTAIYEASDDWRYSDGTSLTGDLVLKNGEKVNADDTQEPISDEVYYISPNKCTECKGFHEEPQCAAVCPVDCCVPDDDNVETEEVLLEKQSFMHPNG